MRALRHRNELGELGAMNFMKLGHVSFRILELDKLSFRTSKMSWVG